MIIEHPIDSPNHPHPSERQLSLFSIGNLDVRDHRRIENHIEECESCLRKLQESNVDDDFVSLVRQVEALSQDSKSGENRQKTQDQSTTPLRTSDRYRLREKIACGGMGEIWSAEDCLLEREVALKVVLLETRKGSETPKDIFRRFGHESRVIAGLQHPGIPPVYDLACLPDGRPFMAMKLIAGHTLRECLEARGDQSVEWYLEIFVQICQTLAFAHDRGITHRDIKPENIMVGQFGETQVMDWGIAQAYQDDQDYSAGEKVVGTPAYMSPEQSLGLRCGPRSDVYSLGLMLCEILAGVRGNRESSTIATLRRAMSGDQSRLHAALKTSGVDESLTKLAASCLEFEPTLRPEHAGELASQITDYLHGLQTRLHAAELEQAKHVTREKEQSRRRVLRGSVFVLVFCVFAVSGFAWLQERSRRADLSKRIHDAMLEAETLRVAHLDSDTLAKTELESARIAANRAKALATESNDRDRIQAVESLVRRLAEDRAALEKAQSLLVGLDKALSFESRRTMQQRFDQRQQHRKEKIVDGTFESIVFLNKRSPTFAALTGSTLTRRRPLDRRAAGRIRPAPPWVEEQNLALAVFKDVLRFSEIQRSNYEATFAEFGISTRDTVEETSDKLLALKGQARQRARSGIRLWFLYATDISDASAVWIDQLIDCMDRRSGVNDETLRFRRSARKAMLDRDPESIQQVCQEGLSMIERQPEELAWGLGCFLNHFTAGGDASYLRLAQRHFMGSYLLNRKLALMSNRSMTNGQTIPYLLTALTILPDQELLLALARKTLEAGHIAEFHVLRERGFATSKHDPLVLFEWAGAMSMSRKLPNSEIIEIYELVIEKGFQHPQFPLARIGQLHHEAGDLELARDFLLQAVGVPGIPNQHAEEIKVALTNVNQGIEEMGGE